MSASPHGPARPHGRFLLVTPVSPFTAQSGAEQRSRLFHQALAELGTVDVVQIQQAARTQVVVDDGPAVRRVMADLPGGPWQISRYAAKPAVTRQVELALGRGLSSYRAVVSRYIWPACQLAVPPDVPQIVDLDDYHTRYGREVAWTPALWRERLTKAVAQRVSRRQLARFTAAFVVSRKDEAELPLARHAYLPNVPNGLPALAATPGAPAPGRRVLFVGALWYRPNAHGAQWLLDQVWPAVRAAVPDAELLLAGAAPPAVRARWARHPGVQAPGFVDDLAAAYGEASLVVAPIHSGGGTNIKVLEALAHGRPCLASDFVHAALKPDLVEGRDLLVARGAAAFAAAIVDVLRDPVAYQSMGQAGRSTVERYFSPQQFQATVQRLVSEVCAA
nr:glycosyltransferase [Variovorax boronicumulans]